MHFWKGIEKHGGIHPKNGESRLIGTMKNNGVLKFNPPGEKREGNDWVLVLDNGAKNFSRPGKIKND